MDSLGEFITPIAILDLIVELRKSAAVNKNENDLDIVTNYS